jgi:RNA-binding protein
MTELTGRQKRRLRALGRQLRPACILGKAGATEGVRRKLAGELAAHELVKVRLPACPTNQRKSLAEQLARATGACCITVVGRTALLYRPGDQHQDSPLTGPVGDG